MKTVESRPNFAQAPGTPNRQYLQVLAAPEMPGTPGTPEILNPVLNYEIGDNQTLVFTVTRSAIIMASGRGRRLDYRGGRGDRVSCAGLVFSVE
ncbi:MAG: hypothetical protein IH914_00205 [candidate division Zixibacteria bacterium]|nr:hypothetical protein [candidate division Zixibacteria bacterium]